MFLFKINLKFVFRDALHAIILYIVDRLTTCPLHFVVELCYLARMILGPSGIF